MKVLLFHAAVSSIAIATMTRIADGLREQGHNVGERFLPAFRLESEPADKIIVALTPTQAQRFRDRGVELLTTFAGPERDPHELFEQLQLPETDEELQKDADDGWVDHVVEKFQSEETAGQMTLAQAKAEAISRGLEVNVDTTRLELEHMLGLSISDTIQAGDRRSDRDNNLGSGEPRIGLRTSNVLPTVNGLDLQRMNDEQLKAAAVQAGLKVSQGMKRETIINKMTSIYAKQVGAPDGAGTKAVETEDLADVHGMRTHAELDQVAKDEGVTFEDTVTTVEAKREAIEQARKDADNG